MRNFFKRLNGRAPSTPKTIVLPRDIETTSETVIEIPPRLRDHHTLLARTRVGNTIVAEALPSFDDDYSPPKDKKKNVLKAGITCKEEQDDDSQDERDESESENSRYITDEFSQTEKKDDTSDNERRRVSEKATPHLLSPSMKKSAGTSPVRNKHRSTCQKSLKPPKCNPVTSTPIESKSAYDWGISPILQPSQSQRVPRITTKLPTFDYGVPSNKANMMGMPGTYQTYPPVQRRPRNLESPPCTSGQFGLRRAGGQRELGISEQSVPYRSSDFTPISSRSYTPYTFGISSTDQSSSWIPPCRIQDLRASTAETLSSGRASVKQSSCPVATCGGRVQGRSNLTSYQSAPPIMNYTGLPPCSALSGTKSTIGSYPSSLDSQTSKYPCNMPLTSTPIGGTAALNFDVSAVGTVQPVERRRKCVTFDQNICSAAPCMNAQPNYTYPYASRSQKGSASAPCANGQDLRGYTAEPLLSDCGNVMQNTWPCMAATDRKRIGNFVANQSAPQVLCTVPLIPSSPFADMTYPSQYPESEDICSSCVDDSDDGFMTAEEGTVEMSSEFYSAADDYLDNVDDSLLAHGGQSEYYSALDNCPDNVCDSFMALYRRPFDFSSYGGLNNLSSGHAGSCCGCYPYC